MLKDSDGPDEASASLTSVEDFSRLYSQWYDQVYRYAYYRVGPVRHRMLAQKSSSERGGIGLDSDAILRLGSSRSHGT